MENKDERYLNVTIKNEEENEEGITVSFSAIFLYLKKFLAIWIVVAIIAALLSFLFSAISHTSNKQPLTALVSFTFDGIESGLDPAGNSFDIYSMKNPSVIEEALTELGRPLSELESVRSNIFFEGIRPNDAIDRIAAYKSIYDSGSGASLEAAERLLETSYYPTEYKVTFDYAATSFSTDEAVEILNTTLDCYRNYFMKTYGYNKALGNAVATIDYEDYDYAEAIDVFRSNLKTLKKYVDSLTEEDTSRFRSSVTGYSFSDLSESIKTIQSIDLDMLSSYVMVKNVTKDKEALMTYYGYRVETLEQDKNVQQELLDTISSSIDNYEKDTVMIFGNGTDSVNTTSTQTSEEYNRLIQQKITTQNNLSETNQMIEFYNKKIDAMKDKPSGTTAQMEKAEEDIAKLNDKINALIENINLTADEYYNTVAFENAYSVIVPASSSISSSVKVVISSAVVPVMVSEVIIFVIYLGAALIVSIVACNKPEFADRFNNMSKNKKKKDKKASKEEKNNE